MKSEETKTKRPDKAATGDLPERPPSFSAEERFEYISTAAYYKASARQFTPGRELEDWLEAAAEFDAKGGTRRAV